MVQERTVLIGDQSYVVVVSDQIEALLAAQAAGRAVLGIEEENQWNLKGIPYVVPSEEAVTEELLELVLRRYLGLPWLICRTERLTIRELTKEDVFHIPKKEWRQQEAVFYHPDSLASYIENQYRFYEYGIWAVVHRRTGQLIGLAGVSNPGLPEEMEAYLDKMKNTLWLELGYHVFRSWRRKGYGREAAAAVMDYSHQVLEARLCALINRDNGASLQLAERLGMNAVMKGSFPFGEQQEGILYTEPPLPI